MGFWLGLAIMVLGATMFVGNIPFLNFHANVYAMFIGLALFLVGLILMERHRHAKR